MSPGQSINRCFSLYATFAGRASRSEYWWFSFLNSVLTQVLLALAPVAGFIYALACLTPQIAANARRLHDRDMSGWWQLVMIVPLVGLLFLIVLALPGTRGPNRFGPDPLAEEDGVIDAEYVEHADPHK